MCIKKRPWVGKEIRTSKCGIIYENRGPRLSSCRGPEKLAGRPGYSIMFYRLWNLNHILNCTRLCVYVLYFMTYSTSYNQSNYLLKTMKCTYVCMHVCCLCRWGETTLCIWTAATNWPIVDPPDDMWSMVSNGGMILTEENRRTRKITCPNAPLSITNSTWTDPGLRGGRPATNRLSHGTAYACS
jgi:hypothetical protein